LLYTYILLAGNSLNTVFFFKSLACAQSESQVKRGICPFENICFQPGEDNTFSKLLETLNKDYPGVCQRGHVQYLKESHSKKQQTFPCRQPALFERSLHYLKALHLLKESKTSLFCVRTL